MATLGPFSFERMIRAVEKVRDRLLRAAAALESAGVRYAVIGGNAVAAWVARVDEAAVRNTQDVHILLRRADFERAKIALESAGFIYRHAKSLDMFFRRAGGEGARCGPHRVRRREGATGRRMRDARRRGVGARFVVPSDRARGLGAHEADVVPRQGSHSSARFSRRRSRRCVVDDEAASGPGRTPPSADRHAGGLRFDAAPAMPARRTSNDPNRPRPQTHRFATGPANFAASRKALL